MHYDCYPDKTHVAATTLDRNDGEMLKVGVHIFTKDKPEWYQLSNDGVERYHEFDAAFEEKFPEVVKKLQGEV